MSGRVGALFSYHGAGITTRRRAAQAAAAGVPVVWDSGAWSVFASGATIDVDTHARWVAASQGHPEVRHVGLDVIGDRDASVANFRRQRTLGADVEPTIHYGEPLDTLDAYLDDNPSGWINAGGIVPLSRGNGPRKAAAFLAAVVRSLDGRARTHALGATHPEMAGPVPFDACDSTYWMSATRYGLLPLFDPDLGDWRKFKFKSRHPEIRTSGWDKLYADGRWLRSEYGVAPNDLDRAADTDVVGLSIESHRRFADWLSQRHGREVTVYLAGAEQIIDHLIGATR